MSMASGAGRPQPPENVTPQVHDSIMNKQLSIHSGSHVWQIDSATRRRGRKGVAEARKAIRNARASEIGVPARATAAKSLFQSDSGPATNRRKIVEAA